MESKRRRIYAFEPRSMAYARFFHNYVSHLVPALARAARESCHGNFVAVKDKNIEKIHRVRFEVNMALVLSAGEFKWSQALRSKLKQGTSTNKLYQSSRCRSMTTNLSLAGKSNCIVQKLSQLGLSLCNPRDLAPIEPTRPRKISRRSSHNKKIEEEEFYHRVSILRRILPGGNELDVFELLSEVESYVVCLQLQVNILRSLVETH